MRGKLIQKYKGRYNSNVSECMMGKCIEATLDQFQWAFSRSFKRFIWHQSYQSFYLLENLARQYWIGVDEMIGTIM